MCPDPATARLLGGCAADALAFSGLGAAAGPDPPVTGVFSGRPLLSVPVSSAGEARAAVVRAREAAGRWSGVPADQRARWARRLRRAMACGADAFLAVLPESSGLGPPDAEAECRNADRVVRSLTAAVRPRRGGAGTAWWSADRPAVVFSRVDDARPLASLLEGVVPALLDGVAVVTEADRRSAVPALAVVAAARRAGLPRHVWQLVVRGPADADPSAVRAVLAEHADGPAPQCCRYGPGSPRHRPGLLVVRHDARVPDAVRGTLRACFARAGRPCSATPAVAVHDSVLPAFLEQLAYTAERFTPVTALPERRQRRAFSACAEAAVGVEVVWHRTVRDGAVPRVPYPLVLLGRATGSPPRTPVGPVASVVPFTAWAEALALARLTGPHLSVYTRAKASWLCPQLTGLAARRVHLNQPTEAGVPPR
ncbi:hypothetical protein SCATT_p13170 (plasmid) [Streptantibioticus cattleyicolor NRRL 8057 = DSM 46488]|uniref:Aldehyde dehydrogenase domain-containing protein n=1 Tax=Streptantibioticus cattleyicolor (strain ATCC 35852 / DSM 46488 / JCM 4925 / NBRC 14057 / NRRL 8057) TaxID=1003195 RepID=G8XFP9_STREN|nr:hypothetical protein SCATT_p13170 [Streptantibioticus cattleyicolor NRRL 8057 = DSM 46488]